VTGVGSLIGRHLLDLSVHVAHVLNTWRDEPGEVADLVTRAAAIVEAVREADAAGGLGPPFVPPAVAPLFNQLAGDVAFRYVAWAPDPQPDVVQIVLQPHEPGKFIVATVVRYIENPARDRLRRCPQCGLLFVDATRNKSAQRCSRACTVKWSNSQRAQKRGGSR
jgi:hypothetical protein